MKQPEHACFGKVPGGRQNRSSTQGNARGDVEEVGCEGEVRAMWYRLSLRSRWSAQHASRNSQPTSSETNSSIAAHGEDCIAVDDQDVAQSIEPHGTSASQVPECNGRGAIVRKACL
eukprot:6191315-Pleurochrysis_carterae.AAC.2